MEIYFVFSSPHPKKEEIDPTYIAHIGKAPRADVEAKALPKSATDRRELMSTFKKKRLANNFAIALVTIDLIYLYYEFYKFTYQKHGLPPLH